MNDGMGRRPGGVEAQHIRTFHKIVGVPLGIPMAIAPLIPSGTAKLLNVPAGGPAQFPGCLGDIPTLLEEGPLAFLGDGEQVNVLALAQPVDLQEIVVQLDTVMGAAPGFNGQLRRHGDELVEVDGAGAFLLVLDFLLHFLNRFRVALEAEKVQYVIGHDSSFPTLFASIPFCPTVAPCPRSPGGRPRAAPSPP